ncbi:hypothetical protein A2U01_0114774, partial [Trifolium medium]|nr:hypothetical protein [Trifolium medium]
MGCLSSSAIVSLERSREKDVVVRSERQGRLLRLWEWDPSKGGGG